MTEEEFLAIWQASVLPVPAYVYRVYHDDEGVPLFYSMEEKPGKYIEIDQQTFNDPPKYARVIDGKLVELKINPVLKLKPNGQGTPCHTQDVSIVVNESQIHTKWSLE